MPFDWQDYLLLAEAELAQLGQVQSPALKEARLRSIISRAYYALFHQARSQLNRITVLYQVQRGLSPHDTIQRQYRFGAPQHHVNRLAIADALDELHGYRKEADYDATMRSITAQRNLKQLASYTVKQVRAMQSCFLNLES